MAGLGILKGKSGHVYEGEWKGNKKHGMGIYYYENGNSYFG